MVQWLETLPLTLMVREECDSNDSDGLIFGLPANMSLSIKILAVSIPIRKKGNDSVQTTTQQQSFHMLAR